MPVALSSKPVLTLAAARQISDAAEAEALRNEWHVSIAIVDDAGRLLHFSRMDGSTNASVDIAIAKAQHAANYRRDTRFHEDVLRDGGLPLLRLPGTLPLEGGLRLLVGGIVVGGIGVSGVQAVQDGLIAQAGLSVLM
ncbi:GlcG/HbpS family heme-binding protein [Tahibacter amnicola]|uniref:Heme-binding protein n=1 Tax=Tahibacter amnicola TaxID=2976241 RepID=A0ABY6BB60_9GAMM|nr:heme-binding protein [Tahibacter amnicola]UXI66772.1 heme-binding protein [Tahibacter amnicola]